jgi:transposase-like protein
LFAFGRCRGDGTLDVNGIALRLLEECLSGLMDEQASELCAERGTSRNGYRERELATCLGTLTLRIPKLHKGSYFPGDIVRRWPTSPSTREHRVRVRTNNVCERANAEFKRRARVVQVLPSNESLMSLVGAVCCEQNDAWLEAKFIDVRSMRDLAPAARDGEADEAELLRVVSAVEREFERKLRTA